SDADREGPAKAGHYRCSGMDRCAAADSFRRLYVVSGFSRTKEANNQTVDEQDVHDVKQQVDRVVAGGAILVTQDRVVEQVGQRGEWPVQPAFADRPPVAVTENQCDVLVGRRMNPRVIEDQSFVVESEPGAERARVREDRGNDETEPLIFQNWNRNV